jgi:hypothetical protein
MKSAAHSSAGRRGARRRFAPIAAATVTLLCGSATAPAEDIEPRAYTNAPVGVNFFALAYAHTDGSLATDTAVPITEPQLQTSNAVFAFAHTLDLWGRSGKVDVVLPYTWLSGEALYEGAPIERVENGPADTAFRVSMNFYGAPALNLRDFAAYRQDLIIGASLQVFVPTGQYDDERIVNIGLNRWAFKPQLGVSKRLGPVILESTFSATVFTDNDDFYGGNTRAQDPLYSAQGHVIYSFGNGWWLALDANYLVGGETRLNGRRKHDLQQNWRTGATLAIPVTSRQSLKLFGSTGVASRTGNSFDMMGIAWQYRWGAGL